MSFNSVCVIIDSICYSPVRLRNILQIKVYQSIHVFWNIVLFTNIVKHKSNSTFLLNTVNIMSIIGLPRWLSGEESACQAGDAGSIPGSEKCPGEGNGNPLQYSCLGNPMDRGDWLATIYGVIKVSDTIQWLNNKAMLIKKKSTLYSCHISIWKKVPTEDIKKSAREFTLFQARKQRYPLLFCHIKRLLLNFSTDSYWFLVFWGRKLPYVGLNNSCK